MYYLQGNLCVFILYLLNLSTNIISPAYHTFFLIFCYSIFRFDSKIFPGYNPNTLRVFLSLQNCRSLLLFFFHDAGNLLYRHVVHTCLAREDSLPFCHITSTIPERTHTHTCTFYSSSVATSCLFFRFFFMSIFPRTCVSLDRVCVCECAWLCVWVAIWILVKSSVLPNRSQLGHQDGGQK